MEKLTTSENLAIFGLTGVAFIIFCLFAYAHWPIIAGIIIIAIIILVRMKWGSKAVGNGKGTTLGTTTK